MFMLIKSVPRLHPALVRISTRTFIAKNEPILNFSPGSKERSDVEDALKNAENKTEDIPIVIGGEQIHTNNPLYQVSPYDHARKVAKYYHATRDHINSAIENSLSVRHEWDSKPIEDRAQILLKAADIFTTTKRAEILAATMIGQAKSVIQAEIDAGPELIDFFNFNVQYALDLVKQQPLSPEPGVTNHIEYRGLEGFIAAISPFNFTAIGGNLAATPALMGNVVLWKPSDTAMLSNWIVYKTLVECGLPPGVIQFLPADGPTFGDTITDSEHLAGINFTGSVPTFSRLWSQVGANLTKYRSFPKLAGECGGKNFHFVHSSADVESVVNGTIRSAFEFSGQKCSACSRAYFPESLWPKIKEGLLERHKEIKVGDPEDFSIFTSSVIDKTSFSRIKSYLDHAKASPNVKVIAGGDCDDSKGYFVQPTILETTDPSEKLMTEEIFGPVITSYVYKDDDYEKVLKAIDSTTPYGLTGSIFAKDPNVVTKAKDALRQSAGNLYINDKSTGSVVAQQWFGGSRKSGTNDKPGSPHYVLKWVSPVAVKTNTTSLKEWKYPSMKS